MLDLIKRIISMFIAANIVVNSVTLIPIAFIGGFVGLFYEVWHSRPGEKQREQQAIIDEQLAQQNLERTDPVERLRAEVRNASRVIIRVIPSNSGVMNDLEILMHFENPTNHAVDLTNLRCRVLLNPDIADTAEKPYIEGNWKIHLLPGQEFMLADGWFFTPNYDNKIGDTVGPFTPLHLVDYTCKYDIDILSEPTASPGSPANPTRF